MPTSPKEAVEIGNIQRRNKNMANKETAYMSIEELRGKIQSIRCHV